MATSSEADFRALIFAPVGRDAALTRDLLARESIPSEACRSLDEVCAALAAGAGLLILTEEVLEHAGLDRLVRALREQPPWSDIPVLVFGGAPGARETRTIELVDALPNVTLLDRPVRLGVAVSVVRAALRARARQYQMRDLLGALEASRRQAETASRVKDEFLATLSHELRTPLNAILGWTTMLRHGEVEPTRVARALEVVDRNARAQAQLVEDVLDMARIITGKLRVDIKPVSLPAVIRAAVEAVRPAARAKRIKLVVHTEARVTEIRGDADRLQQVFWNLMSNAVKFTPIGGEIRVSVVTSSASVAATVTDTGVGFRREFLPFVFDRFRQEDQSVTRAQGGLGIGLALVKQLVELHGGHVEAHSDGEGKGATFRVVLPVPVLVDGVEPRGHRGENTAPAIDLQGLRILVVDAEAATRQLLVELFRRAHASVTTADSAAAALEIARRAPPAIIVAEVGLPDEDGCALMRQIRELPAPAGQVPAIALSAYTRMQDRDAALAAGFTEFVGKPALRQRLLRAVQRLTD